MIKYWVIGAGGMLGSSLIRGISAKVGWAQIKNEAFNWGDRTSLSRELQAAALKFWSALEDGDEWRIYWAAGIGAMTSTPPELETEAFALKILLDCLGELIKQKPHYGCIGFSSSAGAIYSASRAAKINEHSELSLNNPYANIKFQQEKLLKDFSLQFSYLRVFIARISTIYGPGKNAQSKQGLISHIVRNSIRNKPTTIYVPLDTMRDYIYVDDAAKLFIELMEHFMVNKKQKSIVKIIASEKSISISCVIGIIKSLIKKPILVEYKFNELTDKYPRIVSYRSIYTGKIHSECIYYSMVEGISALLNEEYFQYLKIHEKNKSRLH